MAQQQQLTPEMIQMLLGSTVTEEEKAVMRQQQLAQQLGKQATSYNQGMRGAGGAMGSLAQGLQGYQSGKMNAAADVRAKELSVERGKQRTGYFNQIFPQAGGQVAPTGAVPETAQERMLREQWSQAYGS